MAKLAYILRISLAVSIVLGVAAPDAAGERRRRRDRFPTLAQMLSGAKASKSRLAAAVALSDLRDPRAVGPLIFALNDDSPAVRAVAAAGLGRLRAKSALAPLRAAMDDKSKAVRIAATDAIAEISRIEAQPEQRHRGASYHISPRERPRMSSGKPELYVVLKSTSDDSVKSKKKDQAWREKQMRREMTASFGDLPGVTTHKRTARRHRLRPYFIDVSIRRFDRRETKEHVEVECEIRVAISTKGGKMLSVMSGGAISQVPRRKFQKMFEQQMQSEALTGALQGIQSDIFAFLQDGPT